MAAVDGIDWMLISLKRTPERLAAFEAFNSKVALRYELLEAVDGQLVDREQLVRNGIMAEGLNWGPGAIGAALSHRLCWERAVETGRPVGILEDDVYMRLDFLQRLPELIAGLPADWDVVHLGYNNDSIFRLAVYPGLAVEGEFSTKWPTASECQQFAGMSGPIIPSRAQLSFGNCCYLVSPKGARKLIEGCFPLRPASRAIPFLAASLVAKSKDALMNGLYWDMSAFVCLPPLAMPLNDKSISTVGVV